MGRAKIPNEWNEGWTASQAAGEFFQSMARANTRTGRTV